jgi:hypothetical protein
VKPIAESGSAGTETIPVADPGVAPRGDRRIMLGLALGVFLAFGAWSAARYTPMGFLVGDGPYYAETAVSLLYDHDLDLRNQLAGGLEVHGAQIALGADGAWYPKHPILLAVLALPFLALLGVPGLLVFNLVVLALLAAALYRLARQFAPRAAAAVATIVLLLGTFLRAYAYNLSPDLLALLLVTAGLTCLLRGRHGRGAALFGIAVLAKTLLLVLLPFAIVNAALRAGRGGLARAAAGCALPIALLLAIDAAMFGSPLVTSYDRNVALVGGRVVTTTHRSLFDNDVRAGLAGEIADPRHGLLPTAPVLLLAVPGFILLFRRRPADTVLLLAISVFLLVLLAAYRDWDQSHDGNRFLMPAIACAAPAVALAIEAIGAWLAPGRVGRVSRPRPTAS